jgi:hypothetical protein
MNDRLHASAGLPFGKTPGIHSIEDWLGVRARLREVSKRKIPQPGIESRPYNPQARLYTRLSDPNREEEEMA